MHADWTAWVYRTANVRSPAERRIGWGVAASAHRGGADCTVRSITRPRYGAPVNRPSSATTTPRAMVITGQPVTENPSQGV